MPLLYTEAPLLSSFSVDPFSRRKQTGAALIKQPPIVIGKNALSSRDLRNFTKSKEPHQADTVLFSYFVMGSTATLSLLRAGAQAHNEKQPNAPRQRAAAAGF